MTRTIFLSATTLFLVLAARLEAAAADNSRFINQLKNTYADDKTKQTLNDQIYDAFLNNEGEISDLLAKTNKWQPSQNPDRYSEKSAGLEMERRCLIINNINYQRTRSEYDITTIIYSFSQKREIVIHYTIHEHFIDLHLNHKLTIDFYVFIKSYLAKTEQSANSKTMRPQPFDHCEFADFTTNQGGGLSDLGIECNINFDCVKAAFSFPAVYDKTTDQIRLPYENDCRRNSSEDCGCEEQIGGIDPKI